MFKKSSLLLAAVVLCTNMGIVLPVSAEAATGETVLVQSNFENCNLGTYTAANQKSGTTDLRNGLVMTSDSALSTGYTIKNGSTYESISEADIVSDGGTKVLRLNTFLGSSYDINTTDQYPVLKTNGTLPTSGKVTIELEVKMDPRGSFYMYHSRPLEGNRRIWRLENGNSTSSKIKVFDNTDTLKTSSCDLYHTYTAIMDTATGETDFYLDGAKIYTGTGNKVDPSWQLYLKQHTPALTPTVTRNSSNSKQIESVTDPQYVYVKSVKVTTESSTGSGSTGSGSTDSGSTGSGSTDSGSTGSGSTDSGSTDSGSTDSGSTGSSTEFKTVLVQSNFVNCNLGAYSATNQKNGTTDLRNGVLMNNEGAITTGYTIKNSNGEYESISEADIVNDDGTKVLRLNTFLKSSYNHASTTAYPIVKTNGSLPITGKVKIDLELKTTKGAGFWMYHTTLSGVNYRLWKLESGGTESTALKVFDNTNTGAAASCDVYNTYTIIIDNATGTAEFYLNGTSVYSAAMPKKPSSSSWQLYFKQANDATLLPTVTRNSSNSKQIESVTDPEYVYVKSVKVTTDVSTGSGSTGSGSTGSGSTGPDGSGPTSDINATIIPNGSYDILEVPEPITIYNAVIGKQHPYLLGNYFDTLKGYLNTDPEFKNRFNALYREAKRKLPISKAAALSSVKEFATYAEDEIIEYAFLYRMTGEKAFAEGAVDLMLKTMNMRNWNTGNTIETASLSQVCAIGFDWTYDYLTAEQIRTIADTVWSKSLQYAYNLSKTGKNLGGMLNWSATCNHNWNLVCNGGFGTAALGFMNDLDNEKATKCAVMIPQQINDSQIALSELHQNGSWAESVDYSQYAFLHFTKFIAALVETVGDDYKYLDYAPLKKNAKYNMYLTGAKMCFNFHDCGPNFPNMYNMMFAAKYYNDPTLAALRDESVRMGALDMTAFDLLWYVPHDDNITVHPDGNFGDTVSMRKSFSDKNGIFVALHGGNHFSKGQFLNHGFMDQGTFVLDVLGERWIEAFGSDSYGLAGYMDRVDKGQRWNYYRCRAEGSNTLVINPSQNVAMDQVWGTSSVINVNNFNGTNPSATVNLTPVYNGATNITRTLQLTDNRKNALLTDVIQMGSASEIYSFMHTKAAITLSSDKKTATLTQGSKQVKVTLSAPSNAVFTVMDATPLSTSPNPANQNQNTAYKKLAIHLTNTTSTTIKVKFEPQYGDDPIEVSENCTDLFNDDFEDNWHYHTNKTSGVFDLGFFKGKVNTVSDFKEFEIAQAGYNDRALLIRWIKDTNAGQIDKLNGGIKLSSDPGSFNPSGVTVIDFTLEQDNVLIFALDTQYASGKTANLFTLKNATQFAVGTTDIATGTGDWQRIRVVLDTNARRHMVIVDNTLVYSEEYPETWTFGKYGLLYFTLTGGTQVSVDDINNINFCRVKIGQLHIYTSDAYSYENMIAHRSNNGVRIARFRSDLHDSESATMTVYKARYNGNTLSGIEKEDVTVNDNEEKYILDGTTSANAFYVWNDMKPYFGKID